MVFNMSKLHLATQRVYQLLNNSLYEERHPEAEVNVIVHQEDIGSGQFVDHIVIEGSVQEPATEYQPAKLVTVRVEVYASSENRPFKVSKTETWVEGGKTS